MTDGDDSLALGSQLCFALYSAGHAFTRAYKHLLEPLGLTYPQYLVMLVLWETPDPLTVKTIGRRLGLDSGTLTPLLKRMEAAGLLERRRDAADERQVRVVLTGQGRALRARAAAIPRELARATGLSRPEMEYLRGTLLALRDSLAAWPDAADPDEPPEGN